MVKYLYGTSVVFHDDYHVCSGICRQKCFTNINKRSGLMSLRPRVTTTCVTGERSHKESCFLFVVIQPFWGRVGKFLSADLQFSVLVGDNYFSFDVVFFFFSPSYSSHVHTEHFKAVLQPTHQKGMI